VIFACHIKKLNNKSHDNITLFINNYPLKYNNDLKHTSPENIMTESKDSDNTTLTNTTQANTELYIKKSFDNCHNEIISQKDFQNILIENWDIVIKILNDTTQENIKYFKIFSNIDLISSFSQLYLKMTEIPEIWNTKNKFGLTLLENICFSYVPEYELCLRNLTKYKSLWFENVEYNTTINNKLFRNNSALHYLIYNYKNHENIETILKKLITPEYIDLWKYQNQNMSTPLHELCSIPKRNSRNELINMFTYPELWSIINATRITPLHVLCQNDSPDEILIFLSDFPKLWIIKDIYSYTPLKILMNKDPSHQIIEKLTKINQN